jgi:hypothetical protein
MNQRNSRYIYCDCCRLPVAEVRHGSVLVIKARHHGEKHDTIIPLDVLTRGNTIVLDFGQVRIDKEA